MSKDGKQGKKHTTPLPHREGQGEGSFRKLFINLGKKDGFYPGELMQFLNKNVRGHVEVGHIDLLSTMSYFEVPEEDAPRVIKYVNGQHYKGRDVRCNGAEEGGLGKRPAANRSASRKSPASPTAPAKSHQKSDWRQFLNPDAMRSKGEKRPHSRDLKGEEPDFSEEGWAIRKPRKKKS
jgi:ATP-dependent RNA helicase DeaD